MLKKILCVLCTLIILIPLATIPASADSSTSSDVGADVNLWTYDMWSNYYGDVDVTTKDFDFLRNIDIDIDYNYNFMRIDTSKTQINSVYLTSFVFNADDVFYPPTDSNINGFLLSDTQYSGNYYYLNNGAVVEFAANQNSNWSDDWYGYYFGMYYVDTINLINNYYIWLISDLDIYQSFVDVYPNFADQIYYCPDPLQSFLDYVDSQLYDDMFYDVYPLQDGYQNIIRFYDCFDSYYGKYQYDFYSDNMLNYLNSSCSIDSPIYYKSSAIDTGQQLDDTELQHNEMYYIYIPVDDDFSITDANDYLTTITSCIHFELGPVDFSTWYNDYIVPWLDRYNIDSNYRLITLKNVEPSTSDNPTVNTGDSKQNINLLRITFPSSYTFIESASDDGGFLMSGCRTMSTAQKVDISNGSIDDTAKDGVGSNIDGGDYLDDKDVDELLNDGWKNGYPNKSSYPYKITINKNGYVLYEIYFDKKPSIEANFYSDSQIAYDIDFNLTRGYIYAKQQNCYLDFDFRSETEDDYLTSDGTLSDTVTDDIKEAMAGEFGQIVKYLVYGGVTLAVDEAITNSDNYMDEKILRVWTNYTGQLTGVYRGYYVQFNWDLEQDSDFVKNNSDDDHNYSDDYLDDGDGFTDNNGNVHGGASEVPTEDPEYSGFNNDDFSFDENNLWDYANSFLNFSAKAFSVMPSFIWQLIACSIVIIIILRILGR